MKSTDWFHRKAINLFRKQSKLVSIRLWIQQDLLPFPCCFFLLLSSMTWCTLFKRKTMMCSFHKQKFTSCSIYMQLIHRVKFLRHLTDHFLSLQYICTFVRTNENRSLLSFSPATCPTKPSALLVHHQMFATLMLGLTKARSCVVAVNLAESFFFLSTTCAWFAGTNRKVWKCNAAKKAWFKIFLFWVLIVLGLSGYVLYKAGIVMRWM
jgi:hypothetical protein